MITLRTQRIILRPFDENDLQNLIDLDQDADVMRYLGARLTPTDELRERLPKLIERQSRWLEYGTWAADLHSSGENLGWFTFKPLPQLGNEYEVGYRLKKKFWNLGLATEGARYLVDYGFTKLKLPKVVGVTHLENSASQHVLQKSGLTRVANIPNIRGEAGFIAKFEMYAVPNPP